MSTPSINSKILVVDEENTICYDSALVRAMEIAIKTMEKAKKRYKSFFFILRRRFAQRIVATRKGAKEMDFEKLEKDFQKEKGLSNEPYTKEGYAKMMHAKELEEMSQSSGKSFGYNYKTGQDILAYHKSYKEKMEAHEAAKAAGVV